MHCAKLAIAIAAVATLALCPGASGGLVEDVGTVSLHLDAGTLALSDGDPVKAWGSLTQGDVNKRPTYVASGIGGLPSVNFDGANYPSGDVLYESGASVAARTIFAVVNAEAGGDLNGLLSRGDDKLNIRLNDNSYYRSPGHSQDGNDFTGAGGTGEFYINGTLGAPYSVNSPHVVTAVSASGQTYTNLLVGGGKDAGGSFTGRFWDGDISEIIVYDGELSDLDRNQVVHYLGDRYNIAAAKAGTILGTGNGALLGNDLTDLGDDGVEGSYNPPGDLGGFDAIFSSTDEPGFGGKEASFNVFDNLTGGGNNKWCCSDPGSEGLQLTAEFPDAIHLTHFTLASSNDSPPRDPRVWEIQGSNDGVNWETLFRQDNPDAALWTDRDQVILFQAGVDYPIPAFYRHIRYDVSSTGSTMHALGEIEYFGYTPEPTTLALLGLGAIALLRRRQRA